MSIWGNNYNVMISKNRIYKLHYKLRKRGNEIITRERLVTKRAKEVSPIEKKWLSELIKAGYAICDYLFYEQTSKF